MFKELWKNFLITLASIIPIAAIVLIFNYSNIVLIDNNNLILFGVGLSFLLIGASIFSFGADLSMAKIGSKIGNSLTKHKNIWLIFIVVFLIGFIITMAEPDLEILVGQIGSMNKWALISIISLGIASLFIIAALRILFNINISYLLLALYGLIFALCLLVDLDVIPFVFDSGGVTTGSVSVPFILALGVGLSSIKKANKEDSSFGFTGIVSSGPLIVLLIFFAFSSKVNLEAEVYEKTTSVLNVIGSSLTDTLLSTCISILPIFLFYLIYDILFIKSNKKEILTISIGIIITFVGLIFFLSGANIGLIRAGQDMGRSLYNQPYYVLLFSIVIGAAIIYAEPSIKILGEQVETLSEGVIKRKQLYLTLAIGNILALLLSFYKVMYDISFLYIIVPGYILIFILSFIVPKEFVAIAFDSGGIASGTMTAAFITPIAVGMADANDVLYETDVEASAASFGVVAIVAMVPLLVIELLGVNSIIKSKLIYKRAKERVRIENENQIIHFN